MRGDSVRDLYAKTLALLGLGLLAGVGALVDYWPVGVSAPQVAAARLAMPTPLAAVIATDLTIPVVFAEPASPVVVSLARMEVGSGSFPVSGEALMLDEVEPSAVTTPVVTLVESPTPVETYALEVAPAGPGLPPGPDFDPALVYQMSGREDESGLLSSAVDMMKSTGSTIARGGAATGASIVGAFRVVSDAFRKLKFF